MSRAHDLAQRIRGAVSLLGRGYTSICGDVDELERLASDADRAEDVLAWVRDFAESQEPYHSGFKHIVRYIDSLDGAA